MKPGPTGLALAISMLGLSCMPPRIAPPPASIRRVAVLPPSNRTGDALLVSGASLLEKYALGTDRTTVPDALAAEARRQLPHRGFDVVPPDVVEAGTDGRVPGSPEGAAALAHGARLDDAAALYLEIVRWEPDGGTHPTFIIVALDAVLLDPPTGRVVWSAHRSARPVATPGAATLGMAHGIAARAVIEEILATWRREPVRAEPTGERSAP
jgi:hypothetical protein